MRKTLYLSGLFLCMLALCICGCGGGGSAADPMGTGYVRFVSENGTIIDTASVGVNGTITLRAQVTNTRSDGTEYPVVNEQVTFSLLTPNQGGSLTVTNDRTASNGTVTAQFKSGDNRYSDQVRVTTEAGASATIYINKTGGSTAPYIKEIAASDKAVVAGQTSVVTIHVVDEDDKAVSGVLVRFRLTVNNSGAVFADAFTDANLYAYTDIGGNATAVYEAGSADPYNDVYDSVLAELNDYGSSMAVNIKRTAGTVPIPTTGLAVTLATNPSPPSVAAGQTIIITATVTGDEKAGAAVTFTIPVNASGASFINTGGFSVNTVTVTASGTGIATVLYQAGAASPGTAVQDTVQALLTNGANAAVIVTRTATTPSTYTITFDPPPSLTQVSAGMVSIITAKVTTTTGTTTTAAAGVAVSFSLPVNSSGATLSTATATTDASGNAVVIYKPGNTTVKVQDTVQAAVGTVMNAVAITVLGSSTLAYSIEITDVSPKVVPATGGSVVITAKVTNNAGEAISGMLVNFAVTGGAGAVAPLAATTGGNGLAVTVYTAGAGVAGNMAGVVSAGVLTGTYTDAVVVMY